MSIEAARSVRRGRSNAGMRQEMRSYLPETEQVRRDDETDNDAVYGGNAEKRYQRLTRDDDDKDDDKDDDDDDRKPSSSTRTTTVTLVAKATPKPSTSSTSSTFSLPTAQAVKNPSSMAAQGSPMEISSVNELLPLEYEARHRTAEAAILGTILGVLGALIIAVVMLVTIKYRNKKRRGLQLPDNDDQNSSFRPAVGTDQESVAWNGSAVGAEYRPPVPLKTGRPSPRIASRMSDRVSRLWGGSQMAGTEIGAPSEYGGNEKSNSNMPALPAIPAKYANQIGIANGGSDISSRGEYQPPPAAHLSDTTSVRAERLDRVRDDLQSREAYNRESTFSRQSTITIPRFMKAGSWVADQTNRLATGRYERRP